MSEPRRVVAEAGAGTEARLDLLVQAAAQLPDAVHVHLPADASRRPGFLAVVRAFGIAERIHFEPAPAGAPVTVVRIPDGDGGPGGGPWLDWDVDAPDGHGRRVRTLGELVEALHPDGETAAASRGPDDLFAGRNVAVVTNIPTHYRVPLWNRVAERLAAAGARFRVFFSSGDSLASKPWMRPAAIEFDHRFLHARRIGGLEVAFDLEREIRAFRPSILLSPGFAPAVTGRVVRLAGRLGVPFGLWSGDIHRLSTARSRLRRLERRWVIDRTSFVISYGWLSGEYVRSLDPSLPQVNGRNTSPYPDLELRPAGAGPIEVLTVGQAIPRKRLDLVVEGFRLLGDTPARLTVAGGGPELERVRRLAAGAPNIRVLGEVDSERVQDLYREADVFVSSSGSDVFGLVLVEAMGAGLATITSIEPGAVADLAVHEHNCLVVDSADPRAWADSIRRLAADPGLRETLGRNAHRTIRGRWTLEHSADAWIAAFRLGLDATPSPRED